MPFLNKTTARIMTAAAFAMVGGATLIHDAAPQEPVITNADMQGCAADVMLSGVKIDTRLTIDGETKPSTDFANAVEHCLDKTMARKQLSNTGLFHVSGKTYRFGL